MKLADACGSRAGRCKNLGEGRRRKWKHDRGVMHAFIRFLDQGPARPSTGRARRMRRRPLRVRRAFPEGGRDGEFRGELGFMADLGGQGLPDHDGAPPPDVPGARLHHGPRARDRPRDRRSRRNGDAAAVHLHHGPVFGVCAAARSRRDHRHRRPYPGGPVRGARRRRLGGDRARRLSRWPSVARPGARSAPPTCPR